MLPAFRFVGWQWTGDSGSNPELRVQQGVQLPLKHSKAFAWAGHLETVKLMGVLHLGVRSEIRDFDFLSA
jgi:hypothetical protein